VRGLLPQDRVFVAGQSRSGKSELLNFLLSMLRGQWLLLDTKPEFAIPDVEPIRDPAEIDFREPIIHYVPSATGGAAEVDEVFERCYKAPGRRTVGIHELADAGDYNAHKVGKWTNAYVSKGGALGKGLYAGSQLPVHIPVRARTEAQHAFYFVPRLVRKSDHAAMAEPMSMSADELERELQTVEREHGRHSFLWWDSRAQELTAWPPLPEHLRSRIIVQRAVDHA
jgi:hypothetical protein